MNNGLRILVCRIEHETNTFSTISTDLEAFKTTTFLQDKDILEEFENTNTDIGGFLEVINEQNYEPIPSVAAAATPGGIVTDHALSTILDTLLSKVEETAPDGILLGLHGSMVNETHRDADGYILERVRDVAGDIPIMATLDLHANVSNKMIDYSDGLFGYDTYPHTDIGETGIEAAQALIRMLSGDLDPVIVSNHVPLLPPLPPLRTEIEPMQSLLQSAVDSESTKTPDISVFGGFAYADVPEAGFSVVGTCDRSGQEDIQNACKTIAMEAYERREEFQRSYTSVDQAVIKAEEWEPERRGGPLLLADIADNPGGGSAQDDITILKGLLESNVENAALATIIDPEVVKAARKSGIGATITVTIGDYFHERDSSLEVTGQVRNLSDGIYQNRGPMSTGMTVKFGPTTVINLDGIDVIVGSYRQQPYDPQAFESQGIKPESNSVLVLKSTVHFRAGFEPIVGDICEVVTSGSCTPDLSEFYYKNIQRPMYPIDTDL